jgi:hypothetical protein
MVNKQNKEKILSDKNKKLKKQRFIKLRAVFIIFIVFLLIALWAHLTMAGYLDNWLGIELLCDPEQAPITTPNSNYKYNQDVEWGKPVIYLYPEKKEKIKVSLDFAGEFLVTYPEYNNGWYVLASPDGKIINLSNQKEYSYLFWEGLARHKQKYDLSRGFIVKGIDVIDFLQKKLIYLGLKPNEFNEFIVYWAPKMIKNKYNLIHFASLEEYANKVKLDIEPKPNSILRVFMVFKSLDKPIKIQPQKLTPVERNGFSVVEWGGVEVK